MTLRRLSLTSLAFLLCSTALAQPTDVQREYLKFIRAQAAALPANDVPPASQEIWEKQRAVIREGLRGAWGGMHFEEVPLSPQKLGEIQRDGYRIEKLIFQTMPGVWMTALAYVPDQPGKHPAILAVHGHWRGAKQDPVVQARCIGPAKLGFFVLAVDAFGAGERGLTKNLGEYHGEMTAATLFPVGLPLSGLQVYENMRAVDYLRTRPEVDGAKIGITGASGGGNQTMYAGAYDERFGAVVPVCSVGNYQAYLQTACCMCEVVPGALQFTEESGVLSLTAPRGLMVVNATKDGIQFSVGEAKKSLAATEPIYGLFAKEANLKHAIFESPHDYNRAMRESMYGWMKLHLNGEGDGSPVPDPEIKPEEPEMLRCFPGDSRPDNWITIPKFAAREGRKVLENRRKATKPEQSRMVESDRQSLLKRVAYQMPELPTEAKKVGERLEIEFAPEPGITLTARIHPGKNREVYLLLDLDGVEKAEASDLATEISKAGHTLVTCDLRATGKRAWPGDQVGAAPDHNTAQWGLWIGQPLLNQWTRDVLCLHDQLAKAKPTEGRPLTIIGVGPAGIVALNTGAYATSAVKTRGHIQAVAAVGSLASYLTEEPYKNQRMGIMAPAFFREVGDVAEIAALAAPLRVVIAGPVTAGGKPLDEAAVSIEFDVPRRAFADAAAEGKLTLLPTTNAAAILKKLSE